MPVVPHRRAGQGRCSRRDGVPGDGHGTGGGRRLDQDSLLATGVYLANPMAAMLTGAAMAPLRSAWRGAVEARGSGHREQAPSGELGYQRVDGGRLAWGVSRDGVSHDAQLRPAGDGQDGAASRMWPAGHLGRDSGGLGHGPEPDAPLRPWAANTARRCSSVVLADPVLPAAGIAGPASRRSKFGRSSTAGMTNPARFTPARPPRGSSPLSGAPDCGNGLAGHCLLRD